MEPEVTEPELPVPNPCEPLPLEEPPLVCDQPACKPNASVLERANAVIIILQLLIRSCLLDFMKSPIVALELPGEGQGLCNCPTGLPIGFSSMRVDRHYSLNAVLLRMTLARFDKNGEDS